ncbi:MAG TPA: SusC/RagA family protein, partial [Phnomibacter sp.]|nr:SusC/RagA family protein [Phnomibacter sp.]
FGLSSNASYKRFMLSFVARASLNNYVYNNVFSNAGRRNSILGNSTLGNASGNYRATGFRGGNDLQLLSDYYVENASFIRMDNIVLGYNAGKIIKGINNLSLAASVQNAFIITKYQGLDPEHAFGIDNNLYPRPRTFAISLNVEL